MPRSGTSLVAGIFGRKGYFAAADPDAELRTGDQHNPGGYWEAETLTRMNAELFAAAGYGEDTSWLGAPISTEAAARIDRLAPLPRHRELVAHYEAHAPWLWKDPRLCYTLGFWWPLLPAETTRVLLTRRDPEAIWRSFVRLHWREPTAEARADVLERIEAHLRAATATIARLGIPHLELSYEDFAADPSAMARRLSDFLDLPLAPEDFGFSKKLDHSRLRGRIGTLVERAYERLPSPMRRVAKRIAPSALVRVLFPERGRLG